MRIIIETHLFFEQLSALGNIRELDEALRPVQWALATRPEAYEVLPGSNNRRVIKTNPINREDQSIPPFRIFFAIHTEGEEERVILHWIERYDKGMIDVAG